MIPANSHNPDDVWAAPDLRIDQYLGKYIKYIPNIDPDTQEFDYNFKVQPRHHSEEKVSKTNNDNIFNEPAVKSA